MSVIKVFTDGASRGNPGQASIAYLIKGVGTEPIKQARAIGVYSNNQAEYQALIAALEHLVEASPKERAVEVYMDSELVVKQLRGEYRVKDADLKPRHARAAELLAKLRAWGNRVTLTAIEREANSEADRLANQALDERR